LDNNYCQIKKLFNYAANVYVITYFSFDSA